MDESLRDKLERVQAGRQDEQSRREVRHRQDSTNQLRSVFRKKLTTSFIGAIARFEHHFGYLWGHQQPIARCSPEQLKSREVWNDCRNEVLDIGNNQLRGVDAELNQYGVVWNRYQTQFRITEESGSNGDDQEEEGV